MKTVVLFDIDYTLFDTDILKNSNLENYVLYSEVESVLDSLSKNATLGIFSEGILQFQFDKLKKTNIEQYFSKKNIHITENKEEELDTVLKLYENNKLYFVDDKLTILHHAKILNLNVSVVWIKRGKYAETQEPIEGFEPDGIITNLSELAQFIDLK